MSKKATSNIFTEFLNALGMRYTKQFAYKMYAEHPHKNNMFGLSKMLCEYQIPNEGFMLENVTEITSIEPPFIAQFNNNLVVVKKITSNDVHIFGWSHEIKITIEKFREGCSGAVLIAELNENSKESNFKENKLAEIFHNFFKSTLVVAIIIGMIFIIIQSNTYIYAGLMTILVLNIIGIFICYLIVIKQLHLNNEIADKICSMFNKSTDCNNVLESKASKLFGVIDWSELGLGYFFSNTLLLLFAPTLLPYFSLLSICALPYTGWSVWYQKVRVHQWCPLCLVIQLLLILSFMLNFIFGFIQWPSFLLIDILTITLLYLIPFSIITLLLPIYVENAKVEKAIYGLNHIKMNDNVFWTLLEKQPHYETSLSLSKIIFGNSDAQMLVTIVSNPHCDPCSVMHPKIDKLISNLGDQICVQFLFLNFKAENMKNSGKYLIYAYMNNGVTKTKDIFIKWFEKDKNNASIICEKYKVEIMSDNVVAEQHKHEEWCEANKIYGTPTILVNGYRLPEYYNINDLIYL